MGTEALQGYIAPASKAQRRLWFIDRLSPGSVLYNIPVSVRLRGTLDSVLINRAIRRIVERHDALRTSFGMENGQPVQVVRDPWEWDLSIRDVACTDLTSALAADARIPFDLTTGPLFRAVLFRVAADDHVLLLTLHHIVADGWSMNVLVREFTALYSNFQNGDSADLADLPIQYPDFVEWQNEVLASDDAETQLEQWRRHLEGAPLVIDLPADFPRPAEQSERGTVIVRALPTALSRRLNELARAESVTPFMLLLAVFETLLSRCARQRDFLVGTPVAGRSHPDTEDLIGFFVNTLVLRADLEGNPTFRELLARVRQECLSAFAHEDTPFDRLVDVLRPDRDRSRTPLFQTYFVFQSARPAELALPGISASTIDVDTGTAKVDLTLGIEETASGLVARWEYCTDVFSTETVNGWAALFETLCTAVAEQPAAHINALPLLTASERAELISGSAPAASFEPSETLQSWFTRTASLFPGRTAITDGDLYISYRALDEHSTRLARHLRQLGVGPETRVGLCLPRTHHVLVAILGILKAGGAYVPIDPAYPRERIEFILRDSGVMAVLADGGLDGFADVLVIDLALSAETIARHSKEPLHDSAIADNAAYVIYTSGSTGQPKGCVVTHSNVTRLMRATDPWFGFGPQDVWTLFHSFAFDFSVWEIWGALLFGGRLVIVSYDVSRSPEAFHRLLHTEKVTVLNQTPSAFRQLSAADSELPDALSLRYIVFGGEALELATLEHWMNRYGDDTPRLINMYGITETTVHVTYRRIRRTDLEEGRGSVIGVPIPDLSIYVIDELREPVPVGFPGEIAVGGAGLARGYLGHPELTAQRFVANPFGPGRLYRSGDLARRTADGGLEYLGRIDQQVKIRGFRVELGEIERVLARVPGVREVIVDARADARGGKRLIAYLTSRSDSPAPSPSVAREFCRTWLPDYMLPAAFVFLLQLPLTGHGKVDRRALPEPDAEQAASTEEYLAPVTPAEIELAAIWTRVLGLPQVGLNDNFFGLGGDSILTIQVVTLARKAGLRLSPKDLFEQQTLRDLAAVAEGSADAPVGARTPAVSTVDQDTYPAVPMQAGMLFQALLEPERDVYFEQVSGDIHGQIVVPAFRSAWQGLMDRHPVLRTSFRWSDGSEPLQIVNRNAQLIWREHDWTDLSLAEQATAWTRLLAEDRKQGFHLNEAPLWRVTLVRLGADHCRWLWSHFHGLLDGWCLPLVFQDVLAHYEYLASGTGSLPPAGPAYRPYVDWLHAQDRDKAENYWSEYLAGFDVPGVLSLPAAKAGETATDGDFHLRLSVEESAAIRDWTRRNRLTLNTVFQGAWALLLSRYGMGDDVVFGATVAGRPADLPDADRTLGLFINTLPVRVGIANAADPATWLQAIQQSQARMRPFEHSSLIDVQTWSRMPRGQALFETILVFENYPGDEMLRSLSSSLRLENLQTAERTNYLLTAAVVPGEQILLRLHFDARRLESASVAEMLQGWLRLVRGLTGVAPNRLGNISLPDAEERKKLLEWSSAPASLGEETCVHRLVAAQAASHPESPALLAPGREISYREMMARAGGLAVQLRDHGVGPEVCVAVCMEKSPELVIAWLAILIAGGAFVPLDPRFAATRLASVVADTKPRLLILHEATAWVAALTSLPVLDIDHSVSVDDNSSFAEVSTHSLAYIIHTSGSTGKPKGVMLSHGGLSNLALAQAAACGLGSCSRGLQFASVSFDAAVSEVFMSLVSGAAIWLEPRDHVPDPAAFATLIETANIDNATLPPALLQALSPDNFRNLRTLLIAGEAASEELFRRWSEAGRKVFNAYGPTETTVCASMEEVLPNQVPVTLGRPLANLTVYIVDGQMNLVPTGLAGEIVVGGKGVARGYLNRPGLTASAFIPDPFSTRPGSRLYRTGDLGRWTAGGRVEFLGRADRQIKVRGFRVEPAEAEAALKSHSSVSDAIVLAKHDDRGTYLAAFIVANANTSPSDLLEHVRGILPDYATPRNVTILQSWPLTPAGKVDRQALMKMEPETASQSGAEYAEFADETEMQLAKIWADVLRLPAVGPEQNFFELGGDSILSLQIIARASQAGLTITPRQIFRNPTIRRLVPLVERNTSADISIADEIGSIPLTPIQHWFFAQNQADPHHWNQSLLLELRDPSTLPLIGRALAAVIGHHDSFRLRFGRADDGGWLQSYAERAERSPEIQTFSEAEMRSAMANLQSSLDLAEGPLWRAAIFERGESRLPLVFLAVHHLVVDGVSWRILAEDLAVACRQLAASEPVSLAPPTATTGRWARALQSAATSTARSAETSYWINSTDASADLPVDFAAASAPNNSASAELVYAELDIQTTSAMLREANAAYRLNANELLLAALARTLADWSGDPAHLINIEGHGREELDEAVDVTRTVGWFTTIFPFRLECPLSASDAELLIGVKEQFRAIPGNGLGFGLLRYLSPDVEVRRHLAAVPEPRISFNYLGQTDQTLGPEAPFALSRIPVESGHSPRATRVHWIDINAMITGGRLHVDWIFSKTLHRRSTIECLSEGFLANVRRLTEHCLSPDAGAYTSSDFQLAGLSADELDAVFEDLGELA